MRGMCGRAVALSLVLQQLVLTVTAQGIGKYLLHSIQVFLETLTQRVLVFADVKCSICKQFTM